jgi:hypothetical protein
MNLKSGWNRRSFLSTLGAIAGALLSPGRLNAEGVFNRKTKSTTPGVDGNRHVATAGRSIRQN